MGFPEVPAEGREGARAFRGETWDCSLHFREYPLNLKTDNLLGTEKTSHLVTQGIVLREPSPHKVKLLPSVNRLRNGFVNISELDQ